MSAAYRHDDSHHLMDGARAGNPNVNIYLRPIAAPAALALAGFAGSTWILGSWLAGWWSGTPGYFFPFVMIWGGLAQFIAGMKGYHSRDVLVTVIHPLWGSFYLSLGIVWILTTAGALPYHGFREHFSEVAAWAVVLMIFTWICAVGAFARDMIYFATLTSQAIGTTLAVGGWYSHGLNSTTIRAASYFWMLASLFATWRVAAFVWEENFGSTMVPIFRSRHERATGFVDEGYGEPGVKRGMPKLADSATTGRRHGLKDGEMGATAGAGRPVV